MTYFTADPPRTHFKKKKINFKILNDICHYDTHNIGCDAYPTDNIRNIGPIL